MSLLFSVLTATSAIGAAFSATHRRAMLFLWLTGLGTGAVYLTMGFELLAILQWLVATVTTLAAFFFLVVFDEAENLDSLDARTRVYSMIPAVLAGAGFAAAVFVGFAGSWGGGGHDERIPETVLEANGLAGLGSALVERHLISVEVIAFTLFLCLLGGGVIVRPFLRREKAEDKS